MSTKEFPVVLWGPISARFLASGSELPTGVTIVAALVFAFIGDRCVVADIVNRGWCIPSGRLEPGETPEAAARREAAEEAGLILGPLWQIGHYLLQEGDEEVGKLASVFISEVEDRGPIPYGSESHGVCLLTLDELPQRYFQWDPLIAAVCDYAFGLRSDRSPPFR